MPAKKSHADKGFLLRINAETMELIEKWAADEFRSVNGQLQWIINDALMRYKRKKKTVLQKNNRDETSEPPVGKSKP